MRALGIAPEVMLKCLDMRDANDLKLVCAVTRQDVRAAFWNVDLNEMVEDRMQQVADIEKWRDAQPNGLAATLQSVKSAEGGYPPAGCFLRSPPSNTYAKHLRNLFRLNLYRNED